MRRNGTRGSETKTPHQEPRAARFLKGKSLNFHDVTNAVRASWADTIEGATSSKRSNSGLAHAKVLISCVKLGAQLTEPTAQGLREIVVNDNDEPSNGVVVPDTTSEALALLDEEDARAEEEARCRKARRDQLMDGKGT